MNCPNCNHPRHFGVCPVREGSQYCPCSHTQSDSRPTPWSVHKTGSHLGLKAADGKFVFRKAVNMITAEEYDQLCADFERIVACVNAAALQEASA